MIPRDKIKKLVDDLGISMEMQAKAMNISVKTVYNKWNDKVEDHKFNEKNWQKLKSYVILKTRDL